LPTEIAFKARKKPQLFQPPGNSTDGELPTRFQRLLRKITPPSLTWPNCVVGPQLSRLHRKKM
jgi:hypothetical protein